jgi:hypothetical protein
MSDEQHRLYSGLTAGVAGLMMALADGLASGLTLLAASGLALALIWFADPLSQFVGRVGVRHIARPSPPGLVRAFGWVVLGVFVVGAAVALVR